MSRPSLVQVEADVLGVVAVLSSHRRHGETLSPLRMHDLADDLRDAAVALETYADMVDVEGEAARAAREEA